MQTEPLVIESTINAPAKKVWQAITDKEQMKQWYFDISSFKPEVGFEFKFTAGTEEIKYVHLCKITSVEENKKLAYTWRFENIPGDSLVTFNLFEEGGKTRLKLTHEGVENFRTDDPGFKPENFKEGWHQIIEKSLKPFVEK